MDVRRREFLSAVGGASIWASPEYSRPGWQSTASTTSRLGQSPSDWRSHFSALSQTVYGRPLTYLDNAATTHRPRQVIEALARFDERDNANPAAAMHTLARRAADAQVAARRAVAQFLNGRAEEVVFTRGTSEGVNLVAATWGRAQVHAGDEIVVTVAEHASNLFPWQRLAHEVGATVKVVDIHDDGRLRLDRLEQALTARTRLVAVTHVSNVLGIVYPVADICAIARRHGAATFVDAAQSAPHVRLNVQALGCDFLAFSSHKLLGPMGVGALWARSEILNAMPPYHVGSNMAHGADMRSATVEYGPLRFQAGTPNVSGAVGLAAALGFLQTIGFDAVEAHDRALAAYALPRLQAVPGLRLLGTFGPEARIPVFTFTLEGVTVSEIVKAADDAGVALRGGDLAALPLLRRLGVETAARASAYLYNTFDDIDRLVDVLGTMARRRA